MACNRIKLGAAALEHVMHVVALCAWLKVRDRNARGVVALVAQH